MPAVNATQKATTSPAVPQGMISENAARAVENVGWHIEPPFFETHSPNGTPLSVIEPKIQWCIVISLTLARDEVPTSKYNTKVKTKRTMVVQLARDRNLSLRRDDQPNEYEIEWKSENIKDRWCALRSEFLELCNARPEMAESIQTSMLQMLSSSILLAHNDILEADIKDYCYKAWMAVQYAQVASQNEAAPGEGGALASCSSDVEVEGMPRSVTQKHRGLPLDTVPKLALKMVATCLDDMDACIDAWMPFDDMGSDMSRRHGCMDAFPAFLLPESILFKVERSDLAIAPCTLP